MTPDFPIDQSYTIPRGGDPRGNYTPHTPFVCYFGPSYDSLTSNTCAGTLWISGASNSSGSFSLSIVSIIGGTVGSNGRVPQADTTNVFGSWAVYDTMIVFSTSGGSDSVAYTADSKGIYLIDPLFYYYPPVSRLHHLMDPGVPGTTVWAYKK